MQNSKKILIVCPYPFNLAPGQRFKYEQYLSFLSSNGYSFDIHPFFSEKYYKILYEPGNFFLKFFAVLVGYFKRILIIFKLRSYSGVYIFLNVAPFFNIFEKIYISLSRKVIYDIDDLVFLNKTSEVNKIASIFRNSYKYFYLMKKSNYVITCTSYLYKLAKKYNKNCIDISSTINTKKYKPKTRKNSPVIIGWSGSYSTGPYINIIKSILKKFVKKKICKVLIIGARKKDINESCFNYENWDKKKEVFTLNKIDIGVYPLYKDRWVKGKSGLKALQFMALQIPVVATATGSNFRVIDHKKNGFLVNKKSDWAKYLLKLIKNKSIRKKMGINGRKKVKDFFSVEANKNKYLKIFQEIF